MESFRDFLTEAGSTDRPEVFAEFDSKVFDLEKALPEELSDINIIEKGYSAISKVLGWKFVGGRMTTSIVSSPKLHVKNNSVLISFSAYWSGTTPDRFALPGITLSATFRLTFNKKGVCTGIEKEALSGKLSGGYKLFNRGDITGLPMSKIKSTISQMSKGHF